MHVVWAYVLKEGTEMKYMKKNGNDLIENRYLSSEFNLLPLPSKHFVFMQDFCRLVFQGCFFLKQLVTIYVKNLVI